MFHSFSNRIFRNLFVNGIKTTRVYHLYKSVTRPRKPATGIKDGFEQMEHEFRLERFDP